MHAYTGAPDMCIFLDKAMQSINIKHYLSFISVHVYLAFKQYTHQDGKQCWVQHHPVSVTIRSVDHACYAAGIP